MDDNLSVFKQSVLKNKLVSVWGVGYLGYTKILRLQSNGFKANVFDLTDTGFEAKLGDDKHMPREQIYNWSERGDVPALDMSRVKIASIDSMFDASIHIIAFPAEDRKRQTQLRKLADIFTKAKTKLNGCLVVFQSAGPPGKIDKDFIKVLTDHHINANFASAFRSDWTIEEYFSGNKLRFLAADSPESLEKTKFLYDQLGIKYSTLTTIKEAEIYENARNGLQFTVNAFINQLAFGYPGQNIRAIAKYLMDGVELDDTHLAIGSNSFKMHASVQNILAGSDDPELLSLINEVRNVNLSMILEYAEAIKKSKCSSVTILGLSAKGNQMSIELSPSVILAEYFSKLGLKVYIDDPFYDAKSLAEILEFAESTDILTDKLKSDALIIMADHNKYKFISQDDIAHLNISTARIIIDNVALFQDLKFPKTTNYHAIGDGSFREL